ncbi:MAG: UPF0280 family protein [Methanomassiliicoccales archaeon]|nr:UPF0280 family protein [Methanomassiliicoccales archaeon]
MRKHFEYRESALTIEAPEPFLPIAERAVLDARREIESFIAADPFFQTTFEPYAARDGMADVVRRMCLASEKANVGPMAAVAGAIAEQAVMRMTEEGCTHCIVDNGGDIAMCTSKNTTVGIYSGVEQTEGMALDVPPSGGILGICTSSGTIGPSISFGKADVALVISRDVALADACATRLGNLVVDDEEGTIERALHEVLGTKGVLGVLVMVNGRIGMAGRVPKLVRCDVPKERITKVQY